MTISTTSLRSPPIFASRTLANRFQAVLECPGDAEEGALGEGPSQGDDDHRELAQVELDHGWLVGVFRQLRLGLVHLFADVVEGPVGIEPRVELEQQVGAALVGGGR